MLHLFRNKNVRNVVMGVVIAVSTVVFAIQFGPNSGGGGSSASLRDLFNEKCAAKVYGSCVDPKTQRAVYRLLMPRDESGGTDADRARQMRLGQLTLDGLIERELLQREANRMGIVVTDDDVTDSIFNGQILVSVPSDNLNMAYYLRVNDGRLYAGFKDSKTKKFDPKTYERMVRQYTGRSPAEFRDWQKNELLAAKVRDFVKAPVRVSDAEAYGRYVAEKSTAGLEYVEIEREFMLRWASEPTAAELDAWEKDEAHKKQLDDEVKAKKDAWAPKAKHVRHVLIEVKADASEAEKQRAARTMLAAMARLSAGDSFAAVASAFSADSSAAMGGDVGDDTSGFVPSFRVAADALKPGEVTAQPIESQFGWHLIAKDDESKPLDEAKLRADLRRKLYREDKAKTASAELGKQVREAMAAGADEAKLNELLKGLLTQTMPAATLTIKRMGEPSAAATAADAGAPAGDAGASANDAGALAQADAGKAPNATSSWTTFSIALAAQSAADDSSRPALRSTSAFNRGGDPIDGLDGDAALKVGDFAFSGKIGETYGEVVTSEAGSFAIRLKEQAPASREDFDKGRADYMPQLLAAKRAEALALYVKRLRENAKSDIHVISENAVSDKAEKDDKSGEEETPSE